MYFNQTYSLARIIVRAVLSRGRLKIGIMFQHHQKIENEKMIDNSVENTIMSVLSMKEAKLAMLNAFVVIVIMQRRLEARSGDGLLLLYS
jgi:hypothetical protein